MIIMRYWSRYECSRPPINGVPGMNTGKRGRNTQKAAVRTPVQGRAKEKKTRILEVAFDLFSEQGYESVGMRDIAAAAGVSVGTVYAYFADKKMVFVEVFVLYSEELKNSIFEHIHEGLSDYRDIEEFVYGLIHRFFNIFRNRLKVHRDLILLSLADDYVRSAYSAFERRGEESIMATFIERFGDRITLTDPEATRFVIHKTIDEIVQYTLFYDVPIDRERVFREAARMIARYLEKR
jgi:AcrR family transcriptional regulator